MKTFPFAYFILSSVLVFLFTSKLLSQTCDDLVLSFDNLNQDYVSLTPSPVTGASGFTVETWFYSNSGGTCIGICQTLFSLFDPASSSTFEVGMGNGGFLHFFFVNTIVPLPPFQLSATDYSLSCHHLAVTYDGTQAEFFLNGNSIAIIQTGTAPFNFSTFQVGRGSGVLNTQDWDGVVDDVRLWTTVRTPAQIKDFKDCKITPVSGQITDMVVNWTFDQTSTGVVAGGNNAGAVVLDMSGSAVPNNGILNGFNLMLGNMTSNFICDPCGSIYQLSISDFPAQFPIGLVAICEGAYSHFCVSNNGNNINALPGTTITWESSDGILPFSPDPDLAAYPTAQNALCFSVAPGTLSGNCSSSTTGFADRIYRALIQKTMGNIICTYTTSEHPLQICCPVTNAQVNYVVQIPSPFNGNLCEGQATIDVSLLSSHPYLNPLSPGTTVQWCVDGIHQAGNDNMLSFTYSGLVQYPSICFEVKIQNCICPLYTSTVCIPVDRNPICGTIDALPFSTNLIPDPAGGQYDYLICPGDEAKIGMLNFNAFQFCNPSWQFSFSSSGPWIDLGTSNSIQNTNTLPHTSLPNNPASPYLWPPLNQYIYYRVECKPLSYPTSGCTNCVSNVVRIGLKQPPPAPAITSTTNPICKNNLTTLSINPVPGAQQYTWYLNGVLLHSGPSVTSIITSDPGCYEVVVFDGCFLLTSPKYCLTVCEIVPKISCPLDNPCVCLGVPIRLSGCASYSTCPVGPMPLMYTWSASNGGPGVSVGCDFIHTPDASGTDYTLVVTDPNNGCAAFYTITIVPCQ